MAQALGSAIFCLLPSVFSLVPFNENADRFEMRELRRGDTEARRLFVIVMWLAQRPVLREVLRVEATGHWNPAY